MSEPRDDTTESGAGSRPERKPKPGSYYYDDATGYEIYAPEQDREDSETEERQDEDSETEEQR